MLVSVVLLVLAVVSKIVVLVVLNTVSNVVVLLVEKAVIIGSPWNVVTN